MELNAHLEARDLFVAGGGREKSRREAQTKYKLTPLHQAARNGQTLICEMLLDFKAGLASLGADSS